MTEDQPTVFVIDDDASVRDAIKGVLRSVGLRAETFGSTQDFLQKRPPDGRSRACGNRDRDRGIHGSKAGRNTGNAVGELRRSYADYAIRIWQPCR